MDRFRFHIINLRKLSLFYIILQSIMFSCLLSSNQWPLTVKEGMNFTEPIKIGKWPLRCSLFLVMFKNIHQTMQAQLLSYIKVSWVLQSWRGHWCIFFMILWNKCFILPYTFCPELTGKYVECVRQDWRIEKMARFHCCTIKSKCNCCGTVDSWTYFNLHIQRASMCWRLRSMKNLSCRLIVWIFVWFKFHNSCKTGQWKLCHE